MIILFFVIQEKHLYQPLLYQINGIVFYGIGYNKYNINLNSLNKHPQTVHAEIDACMKVRYTNKVKKVSLLVIRTNPAGTKLLMAKPCNNCIENSKRILNNKGYKLTKIIYSNENGELITL